MIRHKAVKESLEVGKVEEWNDDHDLNPDTEMLVFYNFAFIPFDQAFDTSQTTGSGSASEGLSGNYFTINLESGTTADSIASIRLKKGNVVNKISLPIGTFSLKLETTKQIEFGFFDNNTTPFTTNQAGAYFRVKDGKIYAVVGDGTAETETEIGTPSTYNIYRIEFTSSDIRFYVGDFTVIAQTINTNIPSGDLTIKVSVKESAGESQIARVDFISLKRLRKH